ncbi:TetR/AcrR family transcriptional regulator [Saxibacter everestensis]|uniref:TetR/AcrR family transcriptional regulator n=1 Tax=Saxibacter everestensis TaxID=2909229 RepID=A0ABY8QNI9_9MICO|nr:TetR/AcrR family transcriptional regulator [Brevibacteriaceae bacterium ZFBP1038]
MPEKPPEPTRVTRMPRDARRAQLLEAAGEVFVERGYHATSMDEIAESAGVSKPVLYQHFPGKRELYLALIDLNAAALEQAVTEALTSTSDNKQRVEATIGAYFDFVGEQQSQFRLVFGSDFRDDSVHERLAALQRVCAEAIGQIIAEDTEMPPSKAHLLGRALAGMAEISARHWLAHPEDMSREEAAGLTSTLAWRGISRFPKTHADV